MTHGSERSRRMKQTYLGWISKNIARGLRADLRKKVNALYDGTIPQDDTIYETWSADDGEWTQDMIDGAALDLLWNACNRGYRFGDYFVTYSTATDGTEHPARTYRTICIQLPVIRERG